MPYFRLETNVSAEDISEAFLKETVALMASILKKPTSHCVAAVTPNSKMMWGDEDSKCGCGVLASIGGMGVEENKKLAHVLYEHIEKNLGIPKNKLYILFEDKKSSDIGFNGSTLHDILG